MKKTGRRSREHGSDVSAFLARIRSVLDERGMSQARLARDLGVGEATVSEWFTRGRTPQGDAILRLPEVLRVNGHWLLTGRGPQELEDHGGDAFRAGAAVVLRELERFRGDASRRFGIQPETEQEAGVEEEEGGGGGAGGGAGDGGA